MATSGSFKTTAYDSRCLEFSWTTKTSSVANNTTTISWTLKAVGTGNYSIYTAGNFKLMLDGNQVFYQSTRIDTRNGTEIADGEYTFTHGADGKKSFTAYAEAGIYYVAVNCSGSATFTLDTIPRQATITAAPNFNDEENPTITYTNLAGNSVSALDVCISLDGTKDDIAYRPATKTGTSYTFNLTEAERNVLRNATLSGSNSRKVKFHIRTKIGSNTFYHSIEKTFTVINCKPTISLALIDNNQRVGELTQRQDIYIAGLSDMDYTITASGVKGASITSYYFEVGTYKSTSASGTIPELTDDQFYAKVVDNRGQSSYVSVAEDVVPYFKPTCQIANVEMTTDGTLTFDMVGSWYNGDFNGRTGGTNGSTNVLYHTWYILNSSGDIVDEILDLEVPRNHINGNKYSTNVSVRNLDYREAYTIQAFVRDTTNLQANAVDVRIKALPVFDWSENDFNFNVPVSINGQEIKDFVVDEGVSGGWTYRLWNSGAAECWRRLQITIPVNTAWGSMYSSGSLSSTNLSYPFSFKETPILSVSLMPFGSGGLVMAPGNGYGSATQTGPFEIVRGTSLASGQFLLAYQASGKWK